MISNIRHTLIVTLLMIASLSYVENAIAGPCIGAVYQGEEFLGTYAARIGDCHAVLQDHQNQLELLGWQVNEAESRSWGLVLVPEQNDERRIVIQCNWGQRWVLTFVSPPSPPWASPLCQRLPWQSRLCIVSMKTRGETGSAEVIRSLATIGSTLCY